MVAWGSSSPNGAKSVTSSAAKRPEGGTTRSPATAASAASIFEPSAGMRTGSVSRQRPPATRSAFNFKPGRSMVTPEIWNVGNGASILSRHSWGVRSTAARSLGSTTSTPPAPSVLT